MCTWGTTAAATVVIGASALTPDTTAKSALAWIAFGLSAGATIFKSLDAFIRDDLWDEKKKLTSLFEKSQEGSKEMAEDIKYLNKLVKDSKSEEQKLIVQGNVRLREAKKKHPQSSSVDFVEDFEIVSENNQQNISNQLDYLDIKLNRHEKRIKRLDHLKKNIKFRKDTEETV